MNWRPERDAGWMDGPVRLALSLAAMALIAVAVLVPRYRAVVAENGRLAQELKRSERRERDLEATVARQHESLQRTEGELDSLRFQMDSVELQLDGVDYLSREIRSELGLPASSGTWTDDASSATPQGGAGALPSADRDRLSRAQTRLWAGIQELHHLLQRSRAHHAESIISAADEDRARVDASTPPSNWPVRGAVTSGFGWRTYGGRTSFHTGIDVAVDYGTPVLATGDGVVIGSGWQPGYGWSVLLQHAGGYNTLFAHLSDTTVSLGDELLTGDVVGVSGSSGRSTGPHLHYEIWRNGTPLDPRPFMDGGGG